MRAALFSDPMLLAAVIVLGLVAVWWCELRGPDG